MKQAGHGILLATIATSTFLDGSDGTTTNAALPEAAESYGLGIWGPGTTSGVSTGAFRDGLCMTVAMARSVVPVIAAWVLGRGGRTDG